MDKKGALFFNFMIAVVTIYILVFAVNSISDKYNEIGKQIGIRQISIMEAYREGDNALLYMDRAAKTAAFKVYTKDNFDIEAYKLEFMQLLNTYRYNGFYRVFENIEFTIDDTDSTSAMLIITGVGDKMIKIPTICQDDQVPAPEYYYDFLPDSYGNSAKKACGVYAIKPVFRIEIDKKIWEG